MTRLTLSLLGAPELRADGQPIPFATRRALAVLVYLAVEGRPVTRESLMALLWPEGESATGRGALRTTLAYLRRGLDAAGRGGAGRLQADGDNLAFVPEAGDRIDTRELEAAAGQGDGATLQATAETYRGDFLAGFSLPGAPEFDTWVSEQRERYHRLLSQALERLSRRQLEERQYAAGLNTARRWTQHDPLDEAGWRRLMQLQLAAGDRVGVLKTFESLRERLAQELGLAPSREAAQLAELARRAASIDDRPPASRTAAPPASALPGQLPFVGRLEEHRQMVAAYHAPAPHLVVISGEAGIGKTRLAEEFAAWAGAQGAEVLRGRAFEAGGRLPYQPLVDALRVRVMAINAPDDLLADAWLAELSRLLPELRERYPDLPPAGGDDALARTRLPEAMARLMQALAERAGGPPVLFLDDLQWADAASLDVLAYLARRFANDGKPLLLLLTARAEALSAGQTLSAWLAGLARDLPVTRLAPGPMRGDEVAELLQSLAVEATAATELSDWLIAETKGQPFFIAETLKALAASGWPPKIPARGLLPPSVREMILARLSGLMPSGRDLLVAAAVVGRPASFEELGAVAGLDEAAALPALDAALAARLLVEAGHERPYVVAHDQVREVLLAEAGEARRRVFHRRALFGLAGTAEPAELAHHALAASMPEPAFRHSLAAGEAALRVFAVRDALHHFEQARALREAVEFTPSPDETRRLYLGLGRAHELLAQSPGARAAYESLLAYARAGGGPGLAGVALSHLATLAVHDYAFAEAAAYLGDAARLAEQAGDEAGLADREWRLAQLAHHQHNFRESLAHGERALALARSLGDAVFTANCLNSIGYGRMLLGDLDGGAAAMEEARAGYAALGDRALEVDCVTALAAVHVWRGQPAAAAALAERAYAIATEIENPWGRVYSSNWLAMARQDQGDLVGALQAAQTGRVVAEANSFMPVGAINLLILGAVWRARGDLQRARELHLAAGQPGDAPVNAELVADELCSDYALLGDWPAAAEYARAAIAARRYDSLPLVIPLRWTETEALLRAGQADLARDDAQKWGALVAGVPRLWQAHLRSMDVLRAYGNS
jgi:DNA-binding SARP family transcriptional activator